jgi:hypothetical protein
MSTTTTASIHQLPPGDRRARRRPARLSGRIAVTLAIGACLAATGPQAAGAAPRYRPSHLQYTEAWSETGSGAVKEATALCPAGKVVVGGGLIISEVPGQETAGHITLTRMVPFRAGQVYGFAITAAETPPGTTGGWSIRATATCTDPPPGYRIVNGVTGLSSSTVKKTAAECDGQVALGAGAMVTTEDLTPHGVGLQVVRASGTGDITRAQATEPPGGGYAGRWKLGAYAVCADRPDGYEVRYSDADQAFGQLRQAEATCRDGRALLNAGAAVGTTVGDAPANVTIYTTYPLESRLVALAYENTPTLASWTVAAQAICARL